MQPHPATPMSREARRKSLRSSGAFRALGSIVPSPKTHYPEGEIPLDSEENKARLQDMADAFARLEKNMAQLSSTHKAINSFNESFASFQYGLMVSMFCTNFPNCPRKAQLETMETKKRISENVARLQAKVRLARLKNAQLKQRNAQQVPDSRQRQKQAGSVSFPRIPTANPRAATIKKPTPIYGRSKIPVARDESYSTTDTFIEAPGMKKASSAAVPRTSTRPGNYAPNLNQPPRYMKGLFEIPGASNTRSGATPKSASKPASKPGIGARARIPPSRTNASQRFADDTSSAASTPTTSARARAGLAAKRVQKARAGGLASRPPFR